VQWAIFGALAPIGRLLGYRPEYPYPYGGRGNERSAPEGERVPVISGARSGTVGVTVIMVGLLLVSLLLWQRRRESRR